MTGLLTTPDSRLIAVRTEQGSPAKPIVAAKPIEPVRALTAIRGLAAWWVVAYHFREALPSGVPGWVLDLVARGYLAVDLFFVLSGFVIAINYSHWFEQGDFRIGQYARFLGLRLSRIYPLHLFMMLLFLLDPLAIWLFSSRSDLGDFSVGYYVLSLFLMQTWGIVEGLAWNVPAWSISTEWLAYCVFPLLAMAFFRMAGNTARSAALIVSLLVIVGAVTMDASPAGLNNEIQWFAIFRCLAEFSLGICIYRVAGDRQRSRTESNLAILVACSCFAAYAMGLGPDYLLMPAGFVALVHGLSDERGLLAALLRIAPLQWLGLVSYSTYLCHYFVKIWIKFLLVRSSVPLGVPFAAYILAVLLASAFLYRVVEVPGRRGLRASFAALGRLHSR